MSSCLHQPGALTRAPYWTVALLFLALHQDGADLRGRISFPHPLPQLHQKEQKRREKGTCPSLVAHGSPPPLPPLPPAVMHLNSVAQSPVSFPTCSGVLSHLGGLVEKQPGGWGDGSVGKVLVICLDPSTHINLTRCSPVIPTLRRWRQADPWSSHGHRPS